MKNINYKCFDNRSGPRFLLILSVILLLSTVNVLTQDIITAKGEIIAKGSNQKAVEGDGFSLLSYRIEKIPPSDSKSAIAIRLVITGQFKRSNYTIWINGAGYPAYLIDPANLEFVRIGKGIKFEANSEIAVSRGLDLTDEKIFLPEPFIVPAYLEAKARSRSELKSGVSLNYIGCDGSLLFSGSLQSGGEKCIEISADNPALENGVTNHGWYMQIGDKEFIGGGSTFIISLKDFEKLKDNEWVIIKPARGPSGGRSAGILDKSSLRK